MTRLLISALLLIVFGSVASAQGQYKIQPGDTLTIEVLEDQSLNRNALVLPDGTVTMPLVGSIAAGGQTLSALQASIIAGLTPNFATAPNVFVTVQALNTTPRATSGRSSFDVFIIGAVNTPGKVKVTSGTSLLQFLAESGGFTKFAAKKRIQLRRTDSRTGKSSIFQFNYKAIEDGSATTNSVVLQRGDVIIVPERRLFE
ncbi:MAG: polysaccharide biosynthesis/export family protein [Paracoccaceae bacterium]